MSDLSIDLSHQSTPQPIAEAPPIGTLLSSKLAAAQSRRKPPVTVALDADPTIAVRFKSVIPLLLRDKFIKLMRMDKDLDANIGLLVAQCEAVLINGDVVLNSEGKAVTFADAEFLRDLGATSAPDAVAKFYGGADGLDAGAVEITAVANTIYRSGGVAPSKDEKGNPLD